MFSAASAADLRHISLQIFHLVLQQTSVICLCSPHSPSADAEEIHFRSAPTFTSLL